MSRRKRVLHFISRVLFSPACCKNAIMLLQSLPKMKKADRNRTKKKCSSDPLMRMRGMRETEAIDGLIVTGPTGTNVNDIAIALLDTEEE